MRPVIDMEIQVEITNFCYRGCSNCTRLCGMHPKPFFMSFEEFKQAIDCSIQSPKLLGTMGGEPLAHPEFEKFAYYLHSKVPKEKCGLWTCLPKGKEKYRKVICETYGNVFINSHERDDILHGPILVASQEVKLDKWLKDYFIYHCWIQNSWSASITPKGAYFCEVAAALDMLLNLNLGWKVEPGWWTRSPQHFGEQLSLCDYCGVAMPLKKRLSNEGIYDISPMMYEKLKDISPKLKQKKYNIHDLTVYQDTRQTATYKDASYREKIANRYGIFLTLNNQGYCEPHLMSDFEGKEE